MRELNLLKADLEIKLADVMLSCREQSGELTIEVPAQNWLVVAKLLRDEPDFGFDMLMDVAGVDYLHYGLCDWQTESATETGFDRGVQPGIEKNADFTGRSRFAVVYHLLSLQHNQRLRVRVFAEGELPMVDSVCAIWNSANWFEREVYDLFGILFAGHPDLRRILTDYGFVGHPFRKDFPLIGEVEVSYDEVAGRVVYRPVSIEPRVLVPRVIRDDSRYADIAPIEKPGTGV